MAKRTKTAILAGLASMALLATAWVRAQAPVGTAEKPAALVNGEPISMAEVKAVLDQRPSPVPLTAAQQRELRQAALDMLVDDLLMRQFLRKHGGKVDPSMVTKELTELQDVLKKDNKTLAQFLHEGKMTEQQLRQDVVARIQWKQFLAAQFPDATIKKYYDDYKIVFDKVLVRASHILVKVPADATPAQKSAARARLETLRNEILAGKIDFAAAASKYSECPSKDKGGDIGQFPYKFVVVEPFARAAFALKVGEVSDIVTSEFGYHILRVTDRTKGEPSVFENMRDAIREVMAQDQDLYQRILGEQRKGSKIESFLN